jgi:hypothetical protein
MPWLYQARVVPIGRPATIRGDGGQPVTWTFDKHHFWESRARASDIPVCLNHDHDLRIGNLRQLTPNREWWVCCFELDDALGLEFDVGQNVSVGLKWFDEDASAPRVEELSIVRRGRIPGAEITHRVEHKPKPKPAPAPEPAKRREEVVEVINHPQPVIHRKPVNSRHQAEDAELHRRLAWLEKHTGRYDLEAVILGMQRELAGPSIHDLMREHGLAGLR